MDRRLLKPSRRRAPQTAEALLSAITSPRRRGLPRRMPPELLAALAGTIESVAATAGPVVEATAEAVRGGDPARERERLAVALRNLESAMSEAAVAVRAALDDLDGGKRRLGKLR
jgi:hypothetical protein